MLHLATPDTEAPSLRINRAASKPIINLAELAEVLAVMPENVRRRMPLDTLKVVYYTRVIEKPTLIEEVEAVIEHEETRRARPPRRLA